MRVRKTCGIVKAGAIENENMLFYGPVIMTLVLFIFPYLTYHETNYFYIYRRYDLGDHLLVSVPFCVAIYMIYTSSARRGIATGRYYRISKTGIAIIWISVLINIVIYLASIVISFPFLFARDFIGAREVFDFPGIGLPLRLYLVTMPLMYTFRMKNRSLILWVFVIFSIYRSFAFSERLALIEAIVTIVVCCSINGNRISLTKIIGAFLLVVMAFSYIHFMRKEFQSITDQSVGSLSFVDSISAYYTDTTNKFYLVLNGDLKYDHTFYNESIRPLMVTRQQYKGEMNEFLQYRAPGNGYVNLSLNNPGGFAQDVSDFGALLGLLFIATKFLVSGKFICLAMRNPRARGLLAIMIIYILEYNRFNYLELSFGVGLLVVAAVMNAAVIRTNGENWAGEKAETLSECSTQAP